jgi:heme/copper-type cytochrome/quinol oxidase subunit 1
MPPLSRYFVRSSLVCLAIGFTIGGLNLASKGGAVDPRIWDWLPEHVVLLLFGWLVQLALGVAYWILPRMNLADRGRQHWAWAAFIASQAGIALLLLSMLRLWIPAAASLLALAVLL